MNTYLFLLENGNQYYYIIIVFNLIKSSVFKFIVFYFLFIFFFSEIIMTLKPWSIVFVYQFKNKSPSIGLSQ